MFKRLVKACHPASKVILATALSGTVMSLLGAAQATAATVPAYARIRSLSYAGSGCPAGSVAGAFQTGFGSFSLDFDNYVAETGPGVPLMEKRKNCQLAVNIAFPAGWSFTIFEVDHRGRVDLDGGVTALQKSTYYFQGETSQASLQTTFRGPAHGPYRIKDTLGISAYVWSPCSGGRALNINTQVRLDAAGGGSGTISLDSLDGGIAHQYGLLWRRCQ